jgi:hypothetical protein
VNTRESNQLENCHNITTANITKLYCKSFYITDNHSIKGLFVCMSKAFISLLRSTDNHVSAITGYSFSNLSALITQNFCTTKFENYLSKYKQTRRGLPQGAMIQSLQWHYSLGWASASFNTFLHPSRLRVTTVQFLHPIFATSYSFSNYFHSVSCLVIVLPPVRFLLYWFP